MSGSFLGVVIFFEQEELQALVVEFSDRLRRDPKLAPVLARLVGNHWAAAEANFHDFLQSQLFGDHRAKASDRYIGCFFD
jgi:truncated hemoglobin YjbI